MLTDLQITNLSKRIVSDSTASLAILDGSGSWRTRHFRIRSAWLTEQLQNGNIVAEHCSGLKLVADLVTRCLSAHRTRDLLELWGMDMPESEEKQEQQDSPAAAINTASSSPSNNSQEGYRPRMAKALIALLMLLRVRTTEGMDLAPTYEELAPRGLSVDRTLLTSTWLMTAVLVRVVLWEALKWTVLAGSRRARRLARLRLQTAGVIEREINRLQSEDVDDPPVATPPAGGRATPEPTKSTGS